MSMLTLERLVPGQEAEVVGLRSGTQARQSLRRRLLDLGLTPGTPVKLVRQAPLGDPLAVALRGYVLSIRCADAAMVEVKVLDKVGAKVGEKVEEKTA